MSLHMLKNTKVCGTNVGTSKSHTMLVVDMYKLYEIKVKILLLFK